MLKKLLFVSIIIIMTISSIGAGQLDSKQVQVYNDPTTGARLIFHNGKVIDIEASGEAELHFGDRKDIRVAKRKAILRAKASLGKFLKEELKIQETSEEMVKTLMKQGGKSVSAVRTTVQVDIEKISNSANAILKGVVVKDIKVKRDEKYIIVTVMTTLKTQKIADTINNRMNSNLDIKRHDSNQNHNASSNYKSGKDEHSHIQNEHMYY